MKNIYLDHAATTPLDPDVLSAMLPYFSEKFANPSSLHGMGKIAHEAINNSRNLIAESINADPLEIIFTGSGTESDNIAILGTARKLKKYGNHVITSNIEHHAVDHTFKQLEREGFQVTKIPVDSNGIISVEKLEEAIQEDTILISIMFVNNEIGTIQPIKEIGQISKKKGIIFHTDAVQAFGKLPIDVEELQVDLLSASGHKIYGPKGIGLLYIRDTGINKKYGKYIEPILYGGGHEYGFRPATENVPSIVGLAKAVKICMDRMESEAIRQRGLRDDFIRWVEENIEDSFLNGDRENRLYNNINLGFKYIEGESLILYLDMEGIEASTGSACSSKSLDPSHVLMALGLKKEDAHGSLRLTLGTATTAEDLEFVKQKLKEIVERLRKMSPLTK